MTDQPWKSKNWFSSPWNYLTEVTVAFAFPEQIQVHDVTLRDGEQQAGVEFTADEKLRIAEALSETGIHRIEAGLSAVSPADREAVTRIAAAGFDSEAYAFSCCMVSDVQLGIACGVERGGPTGKPPGNRRPAVQHRVGNHRHMGQERRRRRPAGAVPRPSRTGGAVGSDHRDGQRIGPRFRCDVARPQRRHGCRNLRARRDPGRGESQVPGEKGLLDNDEFLEIAGKVIPDEVR